MAESYSAPRLVWATARLRRNGLLLKGGRLARDTLAVTCSESATSRPPTFPKLLAAVENLPSSPWPVGQPGRIEIVLRVEQAEIAYSRFAAGWNPRGPTSVHRRPGREVRISGLEI